MPAFYDFTDLMMVIGVKVFHCQEPVLRAIGHTTFRLAKELIFAVVLLALTIISYTNPNGTVTNHKCFNDCVGPHTTSQGYQCDDEISLQCISQCNFSSVGCQVGDNYLDLLLFGMIAKTIGIVGIFLAFVLVFVSLKHGHLGDKALFEKEVGESCCVCGCGKDFKKGMNWLIILYSWVFGVIGLVGTSLWVAVGDRQATTILLLVLLVLDFIFTTLGMFYGCYTNCCHGGWRIYPGFFTANKLEDDLQQQPPHDGGSEEGHHHHEEEGQHRNDHELHDSDYYD